MDDDRSFIKFLLKWMVQDKTSPKRPQSPVGAAHTGEPLGSGRAPDGHRRDLRGLRHRPWRDFHAMAGEPWRHVNGVPVWNGESWLETSSVGKLAGTCK